MNGCSLTCQCEFANYSVSVSGGGAGMQGVQDWRSIVKRITAAPSWAAVAEQAGPAGLQGRLVSLLALLHGAQAGLPPYLEVPVMNLACLCHIILLLEAMADP